MIPLLIIILLVIWLIIKVRRQAEYYKVEGLKLSWANKANIEGNVSKWIFVLKDKSGNEIHRYENKEAGNLKDWTNVSVDVIGKKEFDEKIIGDNTLEIYYNDAEESKKLYTTTVNYSESDFSGSIDTTNLEEVQEFKPAFSYEFIMNKKNQTLGIHVEYIKLDGVLATKEQTTIHKSPNRNNKPDNMFSIGSGTENYAAWNANGHNVGDKIFTIESDKQIEKIDIAYTRPRYAPGWIIKENGVAKITETSNRGNNMTPRPVVYTYNIKDGTTSSPPPPPPPPPPPITEIPHQIDGGSDGWCNHGNSIHQDVPGCGRICSDSNAVGRKDKGTWGSWNAYPGSVDCPASKLDQVWKMEGNSRKLAVGDYSRRHVAQVDPMKQFTTGEQLYIKGGKHLRFCADEGNNTICNRGGIGGWERFRFTRNSDGTYSFRGGRHNKWCADEGDKIKCNRNSIGGWEKFRIHKNSDGTYSLKGGRHHRWCADEGNTIRCNRHGIGGWERFRIGKV
jgi:hypothetical protein